MAKGFCGSHARRLAADEVKTRFDDVAGVEESKQEVAEIVEFLRDPGKFARLGGRIPKGVLMFGPPGTGKTLLARAIAGEAQVPFFSMSGSGFVEMYVGVGASRVRGLFEQAKLQAPCIIFINEIDAVGRHRNASGGGGHEEREQTLNQLLVEMGGFDSNKGVIVIGATNRPDVLDPALLRPGRFDRQVVVPLPDVRGREEILRVHMRRVPLARDADPLVIARGAPGFSGADFANLVNEAALFAARADAVGMSELERAKDKIMMGAERHSMALSERDRQVTAYHEAGHALVGLSVPDHDPVYKVSILPRGRALGLTAYLPEADRCSYTRESLNSRICALLGGRVAEALIFGEQRITTGASNDIKCATEIARRMVTEFGMSENLASVSLSNPQGWWRRVLVPIRGCGRRKSDVHPVLKDRSNCMGAIAQDLRRALRKGAPNRVQEVCTARGLRNGIFGRAHRRYLPDGAGGLTITRSPYRRRYSGHRRTACSWSQLAASIGLSTKASAFEGRVSGAADANVPASVPIAGQRRILLAVIERGENIREHQAHNWSTVLHRRTRLD